MKLVKSSWVELPIETKFDNFMSVSRMAEPIAPDWEMKVMFPFCEFLNSWEK